MLPDQRPRWVAVGIELRIDRSLQHRQANDGIVPVCFSRRRIVRVLRRQALDVLVRAGPQHGPVRAACLRARGDETDFDGIEIVNPLRGAV